MDVTGLKFPTKAVHAGARPESATGAVMTPIFQTSTFAQSEPGVHQGWDYSRGKNPTRDALQEAFAGLEGARYGLAFSSGLAAIQAVMQATMLPGDRALVCDDVYGGTGRLFRRLLAPYGLEFEFLDMTDLGAMASAIKAKKPRVIWLETPTNPMMKVIDIRKIVGMRQDSNTLVVVDNTFASPALQSPLALGADIVVHSTTKYIGGHSDLIGGAVMLSNPELHEKLSFVQFAAGSVPSPFECFLLQRSIKTLAVRMEQHCKNAMAVASFLVKEPRVQDLFYPDLPDSPFHAVASQQMRGFSGMLSFNLKGHYSDVVKFLKNLKVFTLAESLGGVESLVNHPEKMTHASVPPELRAKLGIGPNLIRLSVGIEDANDLIEDLRRALKAID